MSSKLFPAFFFLFCVSRTFADSECEGCSIFATCDATFVKNNVYGCGGIWDDDASYLCNDGYEICSSSDHAAKLGLTHDLCVNSLSLEKNSFYMSLQTIDNNENNIYMSDDVYTEILGCANKNSDSWLFINKDGYNVVSKNVFGAQLSIIDSDKAWAFGWYIDGDEIKHTYSDKSINGNIMGGVLCCQSTTNGKSSEITGAEKKATTSLPIQEPSSTLKNKEEEEEEQKHEQELEDSNENNNNDNSFDDDDDDDVQEPKDDITTTTTSEPIETITSTTIPPPPPYTTKGLTPNKCCHAFHTDRYELRCNLLTAKDVCSDSSVARRCYWNNNDCKNGNNSLLADPSTTTCQCTGSGDRKQYYCSRLSDRSTCMFQNCNWKCN